MAQEMDALTLNNCVERIYTYKHLHIFICACTRTHLTNISHCRTKQIIQWRLGVGSSSFWKNYYRVYVFSIRYHPEGALQRSSACQSTILRGWLSSTKVVFLPKLHQNLSGWLYRDLSPTVKIGSIWLLTSLAANLGWPLFQLHVKNAFFTLWSPWSSPHWATTWVYSSGGEYSGVSPLENYSRS